MKSGMSVLGWRSSLLSSCAMEFSVDRGLAASSDKAVDGLAVFQHDWFLEGTRLWQPSRPSGQRLTLKIKLPTADQDEPSATKLPQQGTWLQLEEPQQEQDHHEGRTCRNTLCRMHH